MIKIPVPKNSARKAISHFNDSAIVYVWRLKSDGSLGPVYVYIDPISGSYKVTQQMFRFIQNDPENYDIEWALPLLSHQTSEGIEECDNSTISKSTLFILSNFAIGGHESLGVRITGDKKYNINAPWIDKDEKEEEMNESEVKEIMSKEIKNRLVPVYRFWNVKGGFHAYLTDEKEIYNLRKNHWQEWYDMGVCFYSLK